MVQGLEEAVVENLVGGLQDGEAGGEEKEVVIAEQLPCRRERRGRRREAGEPAAKSASVWTAVVAGGGPLLLGGALATGVRGPQGGPLHALPQRYRGTQCPQP